MKKIIAFLFLTSSLFGQTPNFFYTYLTQSISSTDTVITFTASDTSYVSSNENYYATIWDTKYVNSAEAYKAGMAEIVLIKNRNGNTFNVQRARYGTTARNFNINGRRYKLTVDIYSANFLPSIENNSGNYLTNDGATVYWSSSITDSNLVYRGLFNAQKDTNTVFRTSFNNIYDSILVLRNFTKTKLDSTLGKQTFRLNVTTLSPNKTYYVSLSGSTFDSLSGSNWTNLPFLSTAGTYKNLKIFNLGISAITSYNVILTRVTSFSGLLPASQIETNFRLNAPASSTGTLTESTTENYVSSGNEILVFKIRTGNNGGYGNVAAYISFNFYPSN